MRRGEPEEVTAEFNSSNQLVVTGSGTIKLKVDVRWNDNPSTAGTAFDTLSVAGFSINRSGRRGSGSGYITVNGGQTYSVSGIKYNAVRQNGNKSLCLRDGDGNDCNATVNLGDYTEKWWSR